MRARALSTLGGSTRIGVFIGPFLGAGAIAALGLAGAYWVAMAAMGVAALIAYRSPDFVPPENRPVSGQKITGVTTRDILHSHWRVFLTLGFGVMLVGAIRSSRQIVLPLWADHLHLSPTVISLIYGLVSAIDMAVFYPAGKVMDRHGRLWVVLPSTLLMGISLLLLPLTTTPFAFILVALLLGFGNGIGSGIVMTLAADAAPPRGRNAFLGVWRLMVDLGNSGGPALLAGITALVSLATGIATIGVFGLLATAVFWRWHPRATPR
ncbi:MAG: MFS transporter, partial [Pigmentiphaga sp.]